MKLTLITYDSVVAHNAGYAHSCKALEFSKILSTTVEQFAAATGVDSSDVYWMEVNDSDWCKRMILFYATVPADWQPTEDTFIIGDSYDPKWYPHLEQDFIGWVKGHNGCIDITKEPAKNPHSLYRTKTRS